MARVLGRTSPDPRLGSPVELSGRDTCGLFHLISIGKALSSQGIAHAQRPIHPGFLGTPAVVQPRFDAVPTGRPASRWREGAGNYRPEFIGTDGRLQNNVGTFSKEDAS